MERRSHPGRIHLGTRMAVGILGVIGLTAAASGVPAYVLIRAELERQAQSRVEQGSAASAALFQAEQSRLIDLARLAAERPTLRALLAGGRSVELEAYLAEFADSSGLDVLGVFDRRGQAVGGNMPAGVLASVPAGQAVALETGDQAFGAVVAAMSRIEGEHADAWGTVLVARRLDEEWLAALKAQAGIDLSLLVDGRRRSTTLGLEILRDQEPSATGVASTPAYTSVVPLGGPESGLALEVALPIDGLLRQERSAVAALIGSTAAVALLAGALALYLSRTITRPLDRLTEAARRISQGDLETPVPSLADPPEISWLAAALEDGRSTTRRTLESLSRQNAWTEALLQSIVEGIVTLDQQGRIASFSSGAERLTGWSAAQAVGRPADSIFRTPNGSSFLEQLPRPGSRRPVPVLDRSGLSLTLSVTDARLRSPTGGESHLALVLRDVSEDEAVRQLRSYFLANISHEFRTPLSAIRASVELLLDDLEGLSRNEIAELVHSVFLSVTGLQTLIDNLLESLSIEAGRFTLRRVSCDMARVIEASARVMRPLLERREQPLHVNLPPSLPPLRMDPMRVTQVIVNLLSNASKYSPVRRPIELQVEAQADGVTVRTCDRGEGIAPQDRDNLFRRFVRLGRADPGQYGVGLGLSVVKAIVEEHGGRVGVEPRAGGGSTFWFFLPLDGGEG